MAVGKRTVLGVSVGLSETEVHWRKFLESIAARGINGLKLIVSDNHQGVQNARKAVFASVSRQRCQLHLLQNASAYNPKKAMQSQVHDDIKAIFNAQEKVEADRLLQKTVEYYEDKVAELADRLEENIPRRADGI